jgi:malic enzyme
MGTAAAAAAAMVLAAVVGNPFGPQPGLHFTETPQREYDFVVVGGGTAGSLIAAQLARSNPKWEVLLLETRDNRDRANHPWAGSRQRRPREHRLALPHRTTADTPQWYNPIDVQ